MTDEIEARLAIDTDQIEAVRARLDSALALGDYRLSKESRKTQTDSYYDLRGRLYQQGWSLRIREYGNSLTLTLKRPKRQEPDGVAIRPETENPQDGNFEEVFLEVVRLMVDGGLIDEVPADLSPRLYRVGASKALHSLGLRKVFDVRTDRQTWRARNSAGLSIAEVALDRSEYRVSHEQTIEEGRIEIEIDSPAQKLELSDLARVAISDFRAQEVHQSKFERGVVHSRSSNLREKMETKVTLASDSDYAGIVQALDVTSAPFIKGYLFNRSGLDTKIEDIYFDSRQYALFERGWYLRLRREGASSKLTFRRLTDQDRQGQVLQNEIIVEQNSERFEESWNALWSWLQKIPLRRDAPRLESLDAVERTLGAAGIVPSLRVTINRTAWTIEKGEADKASNLTPLGERVAKLKYDRITFRKPGDSIAASAQEFEVTGVEQDDASPPVLLADAYQTFLAAFVENCVYATGGKGGVDQRINAKYFSGLISLGIRKPPKFLDDGRLSLRVTALRESDISASPSPVLWESARFWASLLALVGGLFALGTGGGNGLFSGGDPDSPLTTGTQIAGLLTIAVASFYLFRRPFGPFSKKLRSSIVLAVIVLATAILVPWAGRSGLADSVSLLGLVPLLVTMLRDGLHTD
jgi:adenylate cyclase class IV